LAEVWARTDLFKDAHGPGSVHVWDEQERPNAVLVK